MPLLFFLIGICASNLASSMMLVKSAVDQELREAPLIVEMEVLNAENFSDPVFRVIRLSDAKITRILTTRDDGGWFPAVGDVISIFSVGGELHGMGVSIPGYPRPSVGQQYQAFLKRKDNHLFEIAGFEFGLISLNASTENYSRNRTDGSDGAGTGPFLYWDPTFIPVPYYVASTSFVGFSSFSKAIDSAFQAWRDVAGTKMEFVGMGCTRNTKDDNDGINNVIYARDSWAFATSAIAITRNFYVAGTDAKAGLILDSDILLNGVNHAFTTTNEPGKFDVQEIVTHEAGHFIGMGHEVAPIDTTATMYSVAAANETLKRVLKADDLLGLTTAYGGSGTGKKSSFVPASCAISSGSPGGCAAVHDSGTPASLVWGLLFTAGLIGAGRFFCRRNARLNRLHSPHQNWAV